MRAALPLLLVVVLSLLATTASAQDAACPEVKPGVSIGPIKLGMTIAELEKTKLPVVKGYADTNLKVGAFEVYLDQAGKVQVISAGTHACVTLGAKEKVKLADTSLASLAARFPKLCGPMQPGEGATVVDCTNGLSFLEHLGGREIRVSAPRAVEVTCDAWVEPESKDPRTMKAKVTPGAHICFQTSDFTSDLVPDDVIKVGGKRHINTCEREKGVGTFTLSCHYSGVRLVFAEPQQKLSRMESLPVRK